MEKTFIKCGGNIQNTSQNPRENPYIQLGRKDLIHVADIVNGRVL